MYDKKSDLKKEVYMKFQFPQHFEAGLTELLTAAKQPEGNMDFAALVLGPGERYQSRGKNEVLCIIGSGEVKATIKSGSAVLKRSDVFYGTPALVRVPDGEKFEIEGLADRSELFIIGTENKRSFEPEIMLTDDLLNPSEIRAVGLMNDSAVREARTYMDRSNRPETNFFIGEVVMAPGKWSSFPPHFHKETEIYFYKFLPENGYGYAEVAGDVEIVRQHSLTMMSQAEGHPQVTTPGYAEWYLWCIRLDDEKELVTTFIPEHEWANSKDAPLYPNLPVTE